MKYPVSRFRISVLALAFALVLALVLPVSASVLTEETSAPAGVSPFSKNAVMSEPIQFSAKDFRVVGDEAAVLDSLILTSLPDPNAGVLTLGGQFLTSGDIITLNALDGLCFQPSNNSAQYETTFSFTPVFSSGIAGEEVNVDLYLLNNENNAPVAENLAFTTYKNIAYSGQFSAFDPEGDIITFQLVDKPARGEIKMPADGSLVFQYTPYENKTGKDSFTYVAIDAVGNKSEKAVAEIRIQKPNTKIQYADMNGHAAHNAAIRLAEQGIYLGAKMDGSYYFQPQLPVTRSEFVALAMSTVGAEKLVGITRTGFYDDETIETWAKPYVSSALRSGAVQGTISESGQVVFRGESSITAAEAAVILNRLLSVTNISEDDWHGNTSAVPTWACQAAMNLETVGVLQTDATGGLSLNHQMTRAEAAEMLAGTLDLLGQREDSNWLKW